MDEGRLARVGVLGALASLLLCVTPAAAIALCLIAFSTASGWLEASLILGGLAVVAVAVVAWVRRRRTAAG